MKESKDEKQSADSIDQSRELQIDCEQAENLIHELLDCRQSLLSDERVRLHVEQCDQCAELIVDFGALDDSLSQIPLATLHRLSGIQMTEPEKKAVRLHPLSFIASIACILLVLLTSGIWFAESPVPVRVSSDSIGHAAYVMDESSSEVQTESSPAQSQSFALVHTHKSSVMPTVLLMGSGQLEQISDEVEPIQDYLEMTGDLPGLRPVKESVNATFHLIRGTMSVQPAPSGIKNNDEEESSGGSDVGFQNTNKWLLCRV